MSVSFDHILGLLIVTLHDSPNRRQYIEEFQQAVWGEDYAYEEWIREIFSELAGTLDYYEPNAYYRAEDPSFYGEDQLQTEIRDGLRRLREGGVYVPPIEGT